MVKNCSWAYLLVAVVFGCHAAAQERNALRLVPNFNDSLDPIVAILYPPEILASDAAIALRYATIFSVLGWNHFAACDPAKKALTFWGERVQLGDDVCNDPQRAGEIFAYSILRAAEHEFPEAMVPFAQKMKELGFDPENRSTEMTTAIGFAYADGSRLANWLAIDGWNSRGDLSRRDFPQRFEDYMGYTPVNSPSTLDYPLRWQPLVQPVSKIGRFSTQTHVVPFLGQLRPLVLTKEEMESRQVDFPYKNMNSHRLTGEDVKTMDALVQDLLEISANLTPKQRFLARWWENKILSVPFFAFSFAGTRGLMGSAFFNRWGLGEMLALHDALIVAWKEKRRIDAVRPQTIIQHFHKDEEVAAYAPQEGMVKTIKGRDWEPIVPIQPHSEFPSASACLCAAFSENAELLLKEYMVENGLGKEPVIPITIDPLLFGDTEGVTELKFDSMKEAGKNCGQSRLWAGVHFGPSVAAGERLGEGIGTKGYDFAKRLAQGEVPNTCWWCTRS